MSQPQPQRDHLQEAHKVLRRVQLKFGHTFSVSMTIRVGYEFADALAKDSTGLQALRFAEDLEEILTPMKG